MEIHFRVDSSSKLGLGHVSRCLNLADALAGYGHQSIFFCRDLPGSPVPWIKSRGHRARIIKTSSEKEIEIDQLTDYDLYTIERHDLPSPDWIVVDTYALGKEWELLAQSDHTRVMVIDDYIDRPHNADIYLNQNIISLELRVLQNNDVNAEKNLLGPKFALLSKEYYDLRKKAKVRSGRIRQVFVYFGGVDHQDYLTRSLKCLNEVFGNEVSMVLVPPVMGPNLEAIHTYCREFRNISVMDGGGSLSRLMVDSQIAVGAFGATTWERASLGLPVLGVAISDNQKRVAENAKKTGVGVVLPSDETGFELSLRESLLELKTFGIAPSWSQQCFKASDGLGSHRVVQAMISFVQSISQ